jgi:hypothetical protein
MGRVVLMSTDHFPSKVKNQGRLAVIKATTSPMNFRQISRLALKKNLLLLFQAGNIRVEIHAQNNGAVIVRH